MIKELISYVSAASNIKRLKLEANRQSLSKVSDLHLLLVHESSLIDDQLTLGRPDGVIESFARHPSAPIKAQLLDGEILSLESIEALISDHLGIWYVYEVKLRALNIGKSLHNFIVDGILAVASLEAANWLRARFQELEHTLLADEWRVGDV